MYYLKKLKSNPVHSKK